MSTAAGLPPTFEDSFGTIEAFLDWAKAERREVLDIEVVSAVLGRLCQYLGPTPDIEKLHIVDGSSVAPAPQTHPPTSIPPPSAAEDPLLPTDNDRYSDSAPGVAAESPVFSAQLPESERVAPVSPPPLLTPSPHSAHRGGQTDLIPPRHHEPLYETPLELTPTVPAAHVSASPGAFAVIRVRWRLDPPNDSHTSSRREANARTSTSSRAVRRRLGVVHGSVKDVHKYRELFGGGVQELSVRVGGGELSSDELTQMLVEILCHFRPLKRLMVNILREEWEALLAAYMHLQRHYPSIRFPALEISLRTAETLRRQTDPVGQPGWDRPDIQVEQPVSALDSDSRMSLSSAFVEEEFLRLLAPRMRPNGILVKEAVDLL
ncbi:hypothetical protein K466DRAFT_603636 [Polyporus arcularius HHB13444]|uniref:Uncharacterized protein n=1 Tax=Polyporus arcularius HHB13444 TaxID=1314778 RepID=A0A5C3P9L6_9APHY|nr:hypothetical protein K466DRAFT_603636 [Polyporus arcularius HHB13444]